MEAADDNGIIINKTLKFSLYAGNACGLRGIRFTAQITVRTCNRLFAGRFDLSWTERLSGKFCPHWNYFRGFLISFSTFRGSSSRYFLLRRIVQRFRLRYALCLRYATFRVVSLYFCMRMERSKGLSERRVPMGQSFIYAAVSFRLFWNLSGVLSSRGASAGRTEGISRGFPAIRRAVHAGDSHCTDTQSDWKIIRSGKNRTASHAGLRYALLRVRPLGTGDAAPYDCAPAGYGGTGTVMGESAETISNFQNTD